MLYLGTDNALYFTLDDGASWQRLRNNLPPAPVYWAQVQPTFNDLVIGTHGRGVYILDDVTPLRQWDAAQATDVKLFKPRAAYRFRATGDGRESEPGGLVSGESPPYGANIDFYLKSATSGVVLTFTDPSGSIRTLTTSGQAGLNRVWWDLRYEPGSSIQMLTPPIEAPWAPAPRGYAAYGTRIPPAGPIVAPGTYTVRLKAGAHEESALLTVLPDPKSPGTAQSIKASVDFERAVQAEANEAAAMINGMEKIRKQVEDVEAANASVAQAAKDFDVKISALEGKLIDVHNTGPSEDAFRNPVQLYERISWMIGPTVGNPGSGSTGGDLGPTNQQVAVNNEFKSELATVSAEYKKLIEADVPAFNAAMKQRGVTTTIQPFP
jgi:hypothetical protein